MAVADGLRARSGDIDRLQRQSEFDELFLGGHEMLETPLLHGSSLNAVERYGWWGTAA
jgi:hypothetical protein